MRVLLVSTSSGAWQAGTDCYNGSGWVSSVQRLLENDPGVELAMAFPTGEAGLFSEVRGSTRYFPMFCQERSSLEKLTYYYGGYKKQQDNQIVPQLLKAIESYDPDIVQIFGTESEIPELITQTDIPCVIHLQGFLGEYHKAFFPPGIDERTLRREFINVRENIFRNGIRFNYREMEVRAKREEEYMRRCRFFMGRTDWDKSIVRSFNPSATYFHVDEVLRPRFYEAAKWKPRGGHLSIVSTISDTFYKGFGLILQTASILRDMNDDFTWTVVGVNPSDPTVRFFEKHYGILHHTVNVECVGVLPPERIIPLLQDASVYVHPSYIDNSPNSLCEAQYLGVPSIATEVGGVPTLMASQPWNMVPPGDAQALAARIMRITPQDNQMADALARHDKEKIKDELMSAYESILKSAQ